MTEAPKPSGRAARRAATRAEKVQKLPSLRDLSHALPSALDLSAAKNEYFKTDNDKSAILLHAAVLDAYLGICLQLHISLTNQKVSHEQILSIFQEERAPLSSLSSKIHLAYLLGIIDGEARGDLDCIRRIRNAFAHSVVMLIFKTKQITDECKKLKLKLTDFLIESDRDLVFSSYLCILGQLSEYIGSQTSTLSLLKRFGLRRPLLTQIANQIRTSLGLPPQPSPK